MLLAACARQALRWHSLRREGDLADVPLRSSARARLRERHRHARATPGGAMFAGVLARRSAASRRRRERLDLLRRMQLVRVHERGADELHGSPLRRRRRRRGVSHAMDRDRALRHRLQQRVPRAEPLGVRAHVRAGAASSTRLPTRDDVLRRLQLVRVHDGRRLLHRSRMCGRRRRRLALK